MRATATKKEFIVNAKANSSGSGSFVVGFVASTVSVNATIYRQYNFPNPFNLKTKTITLSNTGSGTASITGTRIVVHPKGTGTCKIVVRIYNVAGDLVKEIIDDSATAGQYNYFDWDGKNTSGDAVASGVYFAKVEAPGAPKRDPIKLVVVK